MNTCHAIYSTMIIIFKFDAFPIGRNWSKAKTFTPKKPKITVPKECSKRKLNFSMTLKSCILNVKFLDIPFQKCWDKIIRKSLKVRLSQSKPEASAQGSRVLKVTK